MCKACAGEGVKIVDGKPRPRGCDDCIAQSLIAHKNNVFGITTFEKAAKLCSCLANNHQGESELGYDDSIEKINDTIRKQRDDYESSIPENIYQKKERESEEYYKRRIEELKKLDEDAGDKKDEI